MAQCLVGLTGARLETVKKVISMPVATAQCRTWLSRPPRRGRRGGQPFDGRCRPASGGGPGPPSRRHRHQHAAALYGLEVLASGIEDHDGNTTRFVVVARPEWGIPAPTGHDKTSIVCFQSSDRPGSLHMILGQFAARNLNLTKLESRPTKKALGEYCFVIDIEGHIADEVVADCLRDLHATLPEVKFLGSYPAGWRGRRAAPAGGQRRLAGRGQLDPGPPPSPGLTVTLMTRLGEQA